MTFGNWFILASLYLSFESLLGCVLDYLLLCLSMLLSGLSIRRYFYSFQIFWLSSYLVQFGNCSVCNLKKDVPTDCLAFSRLLVKEIYFPGNGLSSSEPTTLVERLLTANNLDLVFLSGLTGQECSAFCFCMSTFTNDSGCARSPTLSPTSSRPPLNP